MTPGTAALMAEYNAWMSRTLLHQAGVDVGATDLTAVIPEIS